MALLEEPAPEVSPAPVPAPAPAQAPAPGGLPSPHRTSMSKTSKAQGREDSRRVTRRSLQAQSLEMEQMHRGAGSGLTRALAEEGVLAHVHPVAHLHWSPHMH